MYPHYRVNADWNETGDDCERYVHELYEAINDVNYKRDPKTCIRSIGNRMYKDETTCWNKFIRILKLYIDHGTFKPSIAAAIRYREGDFEALLALALAKIMFGVAFDKYMFGAILKDLDNFLRDQKRFLRRIDCKEVIGQYALNYAETRYYLWSEYANRNDALNGYEYDIMGAIANNTYDENYQDIITAKAALRQYYPNI